MLEIPGKVNDAERVSLLDQDVETTVAAKGEAQRALGQKIDLVDLITALVDKSTILEGARAQIVCHPSV